MKLENVMLQSFEAERLHLKGAELIVFAVLFKASVFCNQVITRDVFRTLCDEIDKWLDVMYPGTHTDEVVEKLIGKRLVENTREGIRVYDTLPK